MKLSPNFTLRECTRGQAAASAGIKNKPNGGQMENLKRLCRDVLEPIRTQIGAYRPNSVFRSKRVNRLIKGSRNSKHLQGLAADIEKVHVDNAELAELAYNSQAIKCSKVILEHYINKEPASGWVHIEVPERAAAEKLHSHKAQTSPTPGHQASNGFIWTKAKSLVYSRPP